MNKSRLLGAVCALTIAAYASSANAVLVTEILGLDINGTSYDVTFYSGAGDTFNALWDSNGDEIFGNDSSVFNAAPTFWGDEAGATSATLAIMAALGTVDTTNGPYDSFSVPFGRASTSILRCIDAHISPTTDAYNCTGTTDAASIGGATGYVSFTSAVPVPAAVWLFGSGLLGLIGLARRKKA